MLCSILLFCSIGFEDKLFSYFTQNVTTTGKILDRESNRQIVSVAATGFGMYCWAIASHEGRLTQEEALTRVKTAFRATINSNPKGNRGFLHHFTNEDGVPICGTEVSTIDSAIFYLGAKRAAQLLKDEIFLKEINDRINEVDIGWMMKGKYIRHGFYWKNETAIFIDYVWENYSEGIIIYKLFNIPFEPKQTRYDLSLFAYYYPLCFFDEPDMIDKLARAIKCQQEKYGYWGITATDTEHFGYQDFEVNTVSPLAITTLTTYLSLPLTSPAEIFQSRNLLTSWTSSDRIGIDFGACYILLWKSKCH